MQDFVKQLLADKSAEWTSQLTAKAGFSAEQAKDFLPPTLDKAVDLVKGGAIDFDEMKGNLDVKALASKFDTGALAAKAGIDPSTAMSGLQTLIPSIFSTLATKAGSLQDLIGMVAGAGGGGFLGKLAGKFLGR